MINRSFYEEENERVSYITGCLEHAQCPWCPQQTAWVITLIT